MSRRPVSGTWSAVYLLAQGGLIAAWWLLLAFVPESRSFFRPAHHPDSVLFAFVASDIVVTAGSILAARQLWRRDPRARATLWFTTGGLVYAMLYCATITWTTGEGTLATSLMVPAALITLAIARRVQVA